MRSWSTPPGTASYIKRHEAGCHEFWELRGTWPIYSGRAQVARDRVRLMPATLPSRTTTSYFAFSQVSLPLGFQFLRAAKGRPTQIILMNCAHRQAAHPPRKSRWLTTLNILLTSTASGHSPANFAAISSSGLVIGRGIAGLKLKPFFFIQVWGNTQLKWGSV